MYKNLDYVKRGLRFVNNTVLPHHKKLSTLMIYATEICDSRCKHCNIWAKKPAISMTFEKFLEIMKNNCVTKDTTIGLEGGEFLMHPEADKILNWLAENHPKFDILSNGLNPDKLISVIKKYKPERLYISLDGEKETYKYMRGVDGFAKVVKVIENCKDIVPISLMFTLTPFNSFKDMEDVIAISKKYDIDIRIGIYNNIDFFETNKKAHQDDLGVKNLNTDINSDFRKLIPEVVKETSENYDFLLLYEEWRNDSVKLRCQSITDSLVIHPNGDVPICQNLGIKLGNINENTLDEIFNSTETKKLHDEHKSCNKCWINYHRKYDIVLVRAMENFIPKKLIEVFYGKYQWSNDTEITYKQYMKNYGG